MFLDDRNHRFINDELRGEYYRIERTGTPAEDDIKAINEIVSKEFNYQKM